MPVMPHPELDFLPSDVTLGSPPLVGTMQSADVEHAAAVVIACLKIAGNTWAPIRAKEMGRIIRESADAEVSPFAIWVKNPFFSADMGRLIREGYATKSGPPGDESVELTPMAIEAVRPWVRRSS
jgi:hypothetical protein